MSTSAGQKHTLERLLEANAEIPARAPGDRRMGGCPSRFAVLAAVLAAYPLPLNCRAGSAEGLLLGLVNEDAHIGEWQ